MRIKFSFVGACLLVCTACAAPASEQAPIAMGEPCLPPEGFTETALPAYDLTRMVSRKEHIRIDQPLAVVIRSVQEAPLEDVIATDSNLPFVTGTFNLTPGPFGQKGSRRITCLSDASTLVEEVLVNETAGSTHTFRYIVWNYTGEVTEPISHAVGEFSYVSDGVAGTDVEWTYSFSLKTSRLPGSLGATGRWLFRTTFLDRDYADMMQKTLLRIKAAAEASGNTP